MSDGLWPWAEANQGLGGWVGSVLSAVAIIAAWSLARSEYRRDKRGQEDRIRAEANAYMTIVDDFEAMVRPYFSHVRQTGGTGLQGFELSVLNANPMGAARDLIHVPVLSWPSIGAYKHFRDYWFGTLNLLQAGSPAAHPPLAMSDLDKRDYSRQQLLAELKKVVTSGRRS